MIATHTGRSKGKKSRPKQAANDDRCDLCGARIGVEFRQRWRHLRTEHPSYARGLLLRVSAPLVFIAVVVALTAVHSSAALLIIALALCLAVGGAGVVLARSAKHEAGNPASLKAPALLRGGAFRFVLLGFVFVSLLLTALRH